VRRAFRLGWFAATAVYALTGVRLCPVQLQQALQQYQAEHARAEQLMMRARHSAVMNIIGAGVETAGLSGPGRFHARDVSAQWYGSNAQQSESRRRRCRQEAENVAEAAALTHCQACGDVSPGNVLCDSCWQDTCAGLEEVASVDLVGEADDAHEPEECGDYPINAADSKPGG